MIVYFYFCNNNIKYVRLVVVQGKVVYTGGRQNESSKCDSQRPPKNRQTKKENPHGCIGKTTNTQSGKTKQTKRKIQDPVVSTSKRAFQTNTCGVIYYLFNPEFARE